MSKDGMLPPGVTDAQIDLPARAARVRANARIASLMGRAFANARAGLQ